MNSTPAASRARRTAKSLAIVIDVSPSVSSARRMVASPKAASHASSAALQRRESYEIGDVEKPRRPTALHRRLGRPDYHGSEAALIRLWREKRGEAEPEDLSGNLVVQLGNATEELNRCWYERNAGRRVRDVQRRVKHSAIPWMAATLDGIVEGAEAVFEAKFMLP
jgi:hypothetical protein